MALRQRAAQVALAFLQASRELLWPVAAVVLVAQSLQPQQFLAALEVAATAQLTQTAALALQTQVVVVVVPTRQTTQQQTTAALAAQEL
jgi:hypothetical protein